MESNLDTIYRTVWVWYSLYHDRYFVILAYSALRLPMASDTNILIIDDDADVLHSAQLLLRQHYARVDAEQDPTVINRVVSQQPYEVVLLNMNFRRGEHDGREGLYWLERILTINPRIRVILITTYGDVELAVEAMRQGAAHFLLKPWKNQQLLEVINTALARQPRSTALSTASEALTASPMIGESPLMQSVYELVDKVAPTEANVLILGENGTGKELIAQALHHQSARRSGPFVRVDLGAVAPSLIESELFGHVKGAFTDAHHDRSGPFEEARGGTLFLDEIGNLPLAQQAKLLSVLQSRTVRRVGGSQDIPLERAPAVRHQPSTARRRGLPRRFALPHQHRGDSAAAPARTCRRYCEAGRSLLAALRPKVSQTHS